MRQIETIPWYTSLEEFHCSSYVKNCEISESLLTILILMNTSYFFLILNLLKSF